MAMILSVAGSLVSGFAAMQQAQHQAALAEANAEQQRLNAQLAIETAQEEAEDRGIASGQDIGQFNALVGGTGIAVSSPSVQRSRRNLRAVGQTEQLRTIDRGNKQFAAFQTKANISEAEASNARSQGKFALLGGLVGAAGAAVGSFGGGASSTVQTPGFVGVNAQRTNIQNQINGGNFRFSRGPSQFRRFNTQFPFLF